LPIVRAVSSEPLRSALVRSALVKSMRLSPQPPSAVSFEPLRSAWARPAPFSLIEPFPVNVASSKSPYDRCAPLRSSSLPAVPSMVLPHAIGQLLSPARRCLSISTVHGGAGGDGGLDAALVRPRSAKKIPSLFHKERCVGVRVGERGAAWALWSHSPAAVSVAMVGMASPNPNLNL
jgi:hypothetical protein